MNDSETSRPIESYRVLVLNSDYTPLSLVPLSTISWNDAVTLVYKGNAAVLDSYDREIRSVTTSMKIPSVIVLRDFKKIKHSPRYSKFNVKLRDSFVCQYCGGKRSNRSLTVDHVLARAHGGKTTWQNSVAACRPCNANKRDRKDIVPKEKPKKPTYYELAKKYVELNQIKNSKWLKYL